MSALALYSSTYVHMGEEAIWLCIIGIDWDMLGLCGDVGIQLRYVYERGHVSMRGYMIG